MTYAMAYNNVLYADAHNSGLCANAYKRLPPSSSHDGRHDRPCKASGEAASRTSTMWIERRYNTPRSIPTIPRCPQ